ncbi:MAG: 50S ribosomal protein L23 [bacterium]
MSLFSKKNEGKKGKAEKPESKSMKDLYSAEGAAKKESAGVKGVEKKPAAGNAYKVIIKPLVTEKVSGLGALNKYVFAVAKNTNKIEIAKAIKEVYGIKPTAVNIVRMIGKKARYGRIAGRRKDWKKAIVTLPEGQTIKIYEGV